MNKFKRIFEYKISYLIAGILIGLLFYGLFFSSGRVDQGQAEAEAANGQEPTTWTCSMHPQIQQPEPGQCPICGMDLIPIETTEEDTGPRELEMSKAAMALAEIQTVPVRRNFVEHELRLVGKVEYDETRIKYITAWFPGRLERLFVDYTGTPVRDGDHLVEIYSPSLLTDQEALLQAKNAVENLGKSASEQVLNSRLKTLERARERLRLLGLTDQQIKDIEEKGTPSDRVTFYSPINGVVIHKNAMEGDYVQTGTRIYTIADLSYVWVRMDAYESDLEWIHYGQEVEFTTVSYPGEVFKGRISFIDPFLNEKTRTVKVRVNVKNPNGKLKPEMFVHAVVRSKVNSEGDVYDLNLAGKWISPMHPEIIKDKPGTCDVCGMPLVKAETLGFIGTQQKDATPPLVIPDSAPLITGKRAVVYIQVPNQDKPKFEGREIVLGPRLKDHYIVHSGLAEGEEVVVKGNFKIDSALQIQAKPSMMSSAEVAAEPAHSPGMRQAPQAPEKQSIPEKVLPDLLSVYEKMQDALAQDDLQSAQSASKDWVEIVTQHDLSEEIEMPGHGVMHAKDLSGAREAFQKISNTLIAALEQYGAPKETIHVLYCPMAFNNKGAYWLQKEHEVRNPYFGESMLTCGEVEKSIEPKTQVNAKETKIVEKEIVIPQKFIKGYLDGYKSLKTALVNDNLNAAKKAAEEIQNAGEKMGEPVMTEFTAQIIEAETISDARLAFSVISDVLIDLVKEENPEDTALYVAHCPMAFQNRGADWLQWEKEIRNPYFGDAMLTCGEITETILVEE